MPQDEKFQRATMKADLRARQDELDAAKLRAGDLEREVADLKVSLRPAVMPGSIRARHGMLERA